MLYKTKKGYTLIFLMMGLNDDYCIVHLDIEYDLFDKNCTTVFLLFKDQNLIFYDGKFWSLDEKYHEYIEHLA